MPPRRPGPGRGGWLWSSSRRQRERPHRTPGRDVGEVGVAREGTVDGGGAAQHGDVLAAVALPRDRQPGDSGSGLERPEALAGLGLEGEELAALRTREDDA